MSTSVGGAGEILWRAVIVMLCELCPATALAQTIVGIATFSNGTSLPASAVLEATLEEAARAGVPATTIASVRVASPTNPPVSFAIAYDPTRIVFTHRYVVRGTVTVDGKVLLASDTEAPVITQGHPTNVSITLRPVTASQTNASPSPSSGERSSLQGTAWRLVGYHGRGDTTVTPDDGAKYTIAFNPGAELVLRVDCNRGRGTWKSSGPSQVQLGPFALTRARCPEGSLHDLLVKDLTLIRSFAIRQDHLFLAVLAGGGTYEFAPLAVAERGISLPIRRENRRPDGPAR
jgi:uncharacterized lipoprotein YbaY